MVEGYQAASGAEKSGDDGCARVSVRLPPEMRLSRLSAVQWFRSRRLGNPLRLSEEDAIHWWLSRLTGISQEQFPLAQTRIRSWGIGHVTDVLCRDAGGDELIAGALLCQDVDRLSNAGIPEKRLLTRLRGDTDVWPTWAEIHVASVITTFLGDACRIELDVPAASGRNTDFSFRTTPTGEPMFVEVKALGLSDTECDFCGAAHGEVCIQTEILHPSSPPVSLGLSGHRPRHSGAVCWEAHQQSQRESFADPRR